jgi:ankyrin repeat protein
VTEGLFSFRKWTIKTKITPCTYFSPILVDGIDFERQYLFLSKFNPLLHDIGKRKSAFLPYKPSNCTVLTNLQRGNTEANISNEICLNFHEKSAQGEITAEHVKAEKNVDLLDSDQYTPLHWACYYGQLSSVQLLIEAGADVNKLAPDLISPMLLAAAQGRNKLQLA